MAESMHMEMVKSDKTQWHEISLARGEDIGQSGTVGLTLWSK